MKTPGTSNSKKSAKDVILARRARFISAALAGAGLALGGCSDPAVCLDPPIDASADTDPRPCLSPAYDAEPDVQVGEDGKVDAGPHPCLSPPRDASMWDAAGDDPSAIDATVTRDGGRDGEAGSDARADVGTDGPRICLSVAIDATVPEAGKDATFDGPQVCLSVYAGPDSGSASR